MKRNVTAAGAPGQVVPEKEGGLKETEFIRLSNALRARPGVDWVLTGTVAALLLFGLVMVYSAGPKFAIAIQEGPDFFLTRQLLWVAGSVIGAYVLSRFNYHYYERFAVPIIVVTLLVLIGTAILQDRTLGAARSLLGGSIRPSEFAKLATILYVSVWLNAKRDTLNDFTLGLIPLIFILGLLGVLIFAQPDFSAALTVVLLGCILFFVAGGELRQIIMVFAIVLLLGWILLQFYSNGMQRILDFWAGLHDPMQASYHEQRSLEAIVKGGFFGVGIGNSSTKYTGLPVAPTDSIFAVIVEETGLLGAGFVILSYMIILWRGLDIARRAADPLGSLIASGVTIWILLEAVLNMAVMVGLAPQAGNALPLISYGGSSLAALMAGIGILFSVSRWSKKKEIAGGSNFGAVVDLRWRDRRGSVSRPGHPSGPR